MLVKISLNHTTQPLSCHLYVISLLLSSYKVTIVASSEQQLRLFPSFAPGSADKIKDMADAEIVADNTFNKTSNTYDEYLTINRTNELKREISRTKLDNQDTSIQNKSPKNVRQGQGIELDPDQ